MRTTLIKIVHVVFAASLVAGIAGCKKKDGDSSSSAKGAEEAPKASGIPECDAYVTAMEKFTKCDKLPPEQQKAYASGLERERKMFIEATDKAAQATQCTEAMKGLVEGAKSRGCTL